MNSILKIISSILSPINKILNGMDKKVTATIRQVYITSIVILCIIFAIVGINKGRGSAQKFGIQIIDSTDKVLDIDIRKTKEGKNFNSLIDSEFISEMGNAEFPKEQFQNKEDMQPEKAGDDIVEPKNDAKTKFTSPQPVDKNDLASISKTDEKPVETSVGLLDKKLPIKENKESLLKEETPKISESGIVKEAKDLSDDKTKDAKEWKPGGSEINKNVLPMKTKEGVIE